MVREFNAGSMEQFVGPKASKEVIAPIAGESGESVLSFTDNESVRARNNLSGQISMAELYDQVVVRDREQVGRNAGSRPKSRRK